MTANAYESLAPSLPFTWRVTDAEHELPFLPRYASPPRGIRWSLHRGRGVRTCIIDSGVSPDHPLVGQVEASFAVVVDEAGELTVAEVPAYDTSGHGTACASIVRAIAPDCQIVSMRVLNGMTGGSNALMVGLEWAVAQGFDVVNMSLSTPKIDVMRAMFEIAERAYFAGVILVCSAHNMPIESFPWRFSSTVSVGSHGEPDASRIYYNPKPPVEFLAAGQDITVAWLEGATRKVSGNSFATPRIAGMCAQIAGAYPDATPFEVKSLLHAAASNVRT